METLLWCWGCQRHKEPSHFYKNVTSSTGHEQLCRICKSAHAKNRREQRKANGLCHCGRVLNDARYVTCSTCRSRINRWSANNQDTKIASRRAWSKSVREKVFDYYGWSCACCGETVSGFLTMDHMRGGGNKHRKITGSGARFYAWLVREGFPYGYQTLCYNCNCGKAHNGDVCPHLRDKLMKVTPNTDALAGLLPCVPEVPTTAPGPC